MNTEGVMEMAQTLSDEEAIRSIYTQYSAAVNAGDPERWINLWDEDGRQMFPDAPMRIGKDAIEAAMIPAFEAIDFQKFVINPDGVVVLGEQGYSHGTYSYVMTPMGGGETTPFSGKFLTIFKQQSDGSWKILLDCFNSNGPVE